MIIDKNAYADKFFRLARFYLLFICFGFAKGFPIKNEQSGHNRVATLFI